jgi:DNA primase
MEVITILEILSERGFVRLNRQMNEWYSVYCPFHSDGNERRASCGVSLVNQTRNGAVYPEGLWHCFACGASYNMEEGITKILESHNIQQSGRDWLIENVPGYDPDADFEYLLPQDMYERKLTDELIEKYDVGYDANWIPPGKKKPVPCITFPVRDRDGRTLFLCRRSIQGKLYNYPAEVTKPVYGIYELPSDATSIIICESCINALTAVSYDYNAVALLGTGNAYQMQQLKELGVAEFVICTDGDEAGRRAAAKLQKNLKSIGIVWTINMPDGKDLNDCTKEEFDLLYMERE